MKKIIWLFGQPGAGRSTFINSFNNDSNDTKKLLGVSSDNISIIDFPYDRENSSANYGYLNNRRISIYSDIKNFIDNDNEVIIINGEYVDYSDINNGIMKKIQTDFPDINKEILILNPSDLDELYNRMINTDWFKSDYQRNIHKYPKDWLNFAVNYMKKSLLEYEKIGYKVTEVDTLDGYSVTKKHKSFK